MRSPDGNIEVVRKKNLAPPDLASRLWIGWVEIPGHEFLLRGRKFTDPMAFSSNSRFLALTEFTGGSEDYYRIVVLDLVTDKQTIAYELRSERPEDLGIISGLKWSDDSTLRISTFSGESGESERIWKVGS